MIRINVQNIKINHTDTRSTKGGYTDAPAVSVARIDALRAAKRVEYTHGVSQVDFTSKSKHIPHHHNKKRKTFRYVEVPSSEHFYGKSCAEVCQEAKKYGYSRRASAGTTTYIKSIGMI